MKRCFLPALAGVLLCLGFVPAGHAIEILRWERLPLAVPLVVGQERVVFIERNVRIGVPAGVGEQLRVQSAGGAIYLRASAPIPPTRRLQLQDVEIRRADARHRRRAGQSRPAAHEPVRIVEGDVPATRYGEPASPSATVDDDAQRPTPAARRRATPVAVVLTRATRRRTSMRRCAPWSPWPASAASTCAATSRWTPCCPRCRCARRRWPRGGSKTSG
ncbi:DUF3438 family protein [Comamonas testosteroni]|uniref:DUF3438 family protein n=1 Tax=Comamonas testosteroni TaxID=285 RepID=UPI0023AAD69A|nr:DUF3438 family protein [Comamonas testosteroni]